MSEQWHLSATEVLELVRKKQASAVEVTRDVLDRMESVNPSIKAVA